MNNCQLAKTTTDSKILEQLAHDEAPYVRYCVAQNLNTSSETLNFLSRDKSLDVRCWVARNPNTSVETLNFLSRDEYYYVRCWVALNYNTLFETLKQMAIHDEDGWVSEYILQNPSCNDELYMYIEGRKLLKTLSEPSS